MGREERREKREIERRRERGVRADTTASPKYTNSATTPTTGDVLVLVLSDAAKVPVHIYREVEEDVVDINLGKFKNATPLTICKGVLHTFNSFFSLSSKHDALNFCVVCVFVFVV